MHNWPNITTLEVAIVCTAALILCILPNFVVLADGRRRRRQLRAAAADIAMQRRVSQDAMQVAGDSFVAAAVVVSEEVLLEGAEPAPEIAPEQPSALVESEPAPAEITPPLRAVETERPVLAAAAEPAVLAPPVAAPAKSEATPYQVRLDELRRVKLPNWPPAEVRDDPERKRVWDEAVGVADQPVITAMQLNSPRAAESACLAAAESDGSVLRLHFLLFPELWPVAADQAAAEAIFELDSASGDVRSSVHSL